MTLMSYKKAPKMHTRLICYHYIRKNNQFGKNDKQSSYTNDNVIYRSCRQILVQTRACTQQSMRRAFPQRTCSSTSSVDYAMSRMTCTVSKRHFGTSVKLSGVRTLRH